jgi:hypothetical protein
VFEVLVWWVLGLDLGKLWGFGFGFVDANQLSLRGDCSQ